MNNINNLLNKYWEAETSIAEENEIKAYFASGNVAEEHAGYAPLFDSYEAMGNVTCNIDVAKVLGDAAAQEEAASERLVIDETETKIFSLKRYIPAIAAILLTLIAAVAVFNIGGIMDETRTNVTVLNEESDQEEAIRVTKQALALLSKNYQKGTDAVMNVQHVEKTNIFKSN